MLATALPAALRRGEPLPDIADHGWRLTEAGHTALPGLRAGASGHPSGGLCFGLSVAHNLLRMSYKKTNFTQRAPA